VIAAEPGNYFTPGVEASDQALLRFFRRRHYEPQSDAVNLQAALDDNRLLDVSPDPHVVPAEPDDRNEVVRWVAAEFGRIWAFEASRCFDHALPSLFLHREENEIRGFSAHAANNGGLGTYGPAGVARQWRRHGYGRGLLLASLTDLRERGFRSALIQWAAAVEFYRSVCGARVSERFVILEKRIGRSTNDE
jgi:GNAT superfamily N-acetyltransferase